MVKIAVSADSIPAELKERPQWLLWDASKNSPRRPHWRGNFGASWTDPDDWHTFDEAYAAVQEKDSWGLGYVFAKGNEDYPRGLYSGIDLDGCLTDDGGPKEWLPELEPFNGRTYLEVSPGGDGIHIPLVGVDVPDWWSNVHFSEEEHEGVEFYDKKFFTFTGDAIETATPSVGDLTQDEVDEWLAEVYESISGDDPRDLAQRSLSETTQPRETKKSREDLSNVETTSDYDDILDAVDYLTPDDLPLRSRYTEDENAEYESWDPSYRQSRSGTSLKRHKQTGVFFDMAHQSRGGGGGYSGFDVLSLFAAEEGIIHEPWDTLSGDDWKAAVDRAREAGADIPSFAGTDGDLPSDAKAVAEVDLDAATVWEFWSDARASGEFDETKVIPELALWHVAAEHTGYDMDALPEDCDELPPKAHNRALSWVQNRWPESAGLKLGEDEDVTARRYRRRDEQVLTWEDVRYIYDGGEGQTDKDGGRYAAVRLLRSKYDFATPEDTERLHIYEEEVGVYEPTAELVVDRELDSNLSRFYSQHEKNEILGRLEAGTFRPRSDFDAGCIEGLYLCVENGVIDLETRELLPHDPSYLFISYLPVEFDPDASAPEISEFLDDITRREEDKLTMVEMLGNCFLPNYDYESFMVLFGEGSNGKSTWFSVIRSLLGRDNVTSMTLQTLSDNRFAASNLLGKLANIGEDLPEKKIQNMGTLKDLTGGGETWVEEKGKQGFDMHNRAKLMFAANRPPALGEKSQAVKRRLVPVRLPYQFLSDPDPNDPLEKQSRKEGLVDDLTTDEELSGLLNLALDGLDRLRESGDVSLPESFEERLEYYEQFSDPIKEFSINCLENEDGPRVKKSTVYNAYTDFCRENDYESTTPEMFWREIRRTVLNVSIVRPRSSDGGKRHQYLDHTVFTEFGVEFTSATDDPPVVGDSDTSESSEYGDVTPLSRLETGELTTVTGELKQVYTPDSTKNWFELEGWIVDETHAAKIIVREEADVTLSEGETYRFEAVNVTRDDGVAAIEVVPNISSVSRISLGDGSTDPDGHGWLNEPQPDVDDSPEPTARADGGSDAATEETSDHAGPPDDAVGPQADAQRLVDILSRSGGMAKGQLLAKAGHQYDMDPSRAQAAFEYAVGEAGSVIEDPASDDVTYISA